MTFLQLVPDHLSFGITASSSEDSIMLNMFQVCNALRAGVKFTSDKYLHSFKGADCKREIVVVHRDT